MIGYDVVLIHPPAIYDFRERPIFYGPIAYTVGESTEQFIIPPIGMLSIADYLDRNGYKVIVDNIGERMVTSAGFDAEEHIRNLSARVYGIDLHWCVHSQGAIEIARLCKKLHPEALVVLGGLTSTVFSDEIIQKYEFVDIVIRGEAEKPFLILMQALDQGKKLEDVPNLTFRDDRREPVSVPLMEPSGNLDEYEFTRLDLLEPKQAIFTPGMPAHWTIPICRGCLHSCATCAGSAYSYKTYFGRKKPAFRSPEKIVEDIQKLTAQGIQFLFLCQDPRMGGKDYWSKLFKALRDSRIQLAELTFELFGPVTDEYIEELSKIGVPTSLSISPESCVGSVRKAHGRNYTNEELFRTIKTCKRLGIPVGVFSMIALGSDSPQTIREAWKVWEQICVLDQNSKGDASVHFAFGPMVLLDPGSHAFDYPSNHGYRLISKTLEDYIKGMSLPSWHQWLSYETKYLDRESIIKLIIASIEQSTNLREKYGVYSQAAAEAQRFRYVTANKLAIDVVDDAITLRDDDEKMARLKSFEEFLNSKLREVSALC